MASLLSKSDRFGGLKAKKDITRPGPEYNPTNFTIAAPRPVINTKTSLSLTKRLKGTDLDPRVPPPSENGAFHAEMEAEIKAVENMDVRTFGGGSVVKRSMNARTRPVIGSRTERMPRRKPDPGGPGQHFGVNRTGDLATPLKTFTSTAPGFGSTKRHDITHQIKVLRGDALESPGPASYTPLAAAKWNTTKPEISVEDDDDGAEGGATGFGSTGLSSARRRRRGKKKDPYAYIYDVPDRIPSTSVLRKAPTRNGPLYPAPGPGFNDVDRKTTSFGNYSVATQGGGRRRAKPTAEDLDYSDDSDGGQQASMFGGGVGGGGASFFGGTSATASSSKVLDDPDSPLLKALMAVKAKDEEEAAEAAAELKGVPRAKPRPRRPRKPKSFKSRDTNLAVRDAASTPGPLESDLTAASRWTKPSTNVRIKAPETDAGHVSSTCRRIEVDAVLGSTDKFKPFPKSKTGAAPSPHPPRSSTATTRRPAVSAQSSQMSTFSNAPSPHELKLADALFKSKRYPTLMGRNTSSASASASAPPSVASPMPSMASSSLVQEVHSVMEPLVVQVPEPLPGDDIPQSVSDPKTAAFGAELLRLQYAGDEDAVQLAIKMSMGGSQTRGLRQLARKTGGRKPPPATGGGGGSGRGSGNAGGGGGGGGGGSGSGSARLSRRSSAAALAAGASIVNSTRTTPRSMSGGKDGDSSGLDGESMGGDSDSDAMGGVGDSDDAESMGGGIDSDDDEVGGGSDGGLGSDVVDDADGDEELDESIG